MSNITPIRPDAGSHASPEHPLSIASRELLMARSCIDVLHDVWSLGDGVLQESISDGAMAGVLYDILTRVRRAEEAVNSLPHC